MKLTRALMIASLALPLAATAKEQALTLQQIPAQAAAAIQAAAGKEAVTIKKETEDGADAFEAKWKVGGNKHEITVTPDGKIISEEEVVALDNTPAPVKAAIEALSASGKLSKIEKGTEKDVVSYEATFETADGKLEVKFDAAGKELSRETEKKDKDKEEKEDHEDGEEGEA